MRGKNAPGDRIDVLAGAGARQDHDELVAAKPHAEVGGAAGVAHALRRDDEHIVAGRVPQRVVDLLEAVEIELQHGEPFAAPVRPLDQRVEMVGEESAVVQAGQPVMDGNEGHRIARVDQLMGALQDHLRHRPEDEQRHQDDDADGGEEQRPVHAQHLVEPRIGESIDTVAKRDVAVERGVRHGVVEPRAFLAGEIAGRRLAGVKLRFGCRDEAPAIGGEPEREIVEMERLGEKHAFDACSDRCGRARRGRRLCCRAAGRSSFRIRRSPP